MCPPPGGDRAGHGPGTLPPWQACALSTHDLIAALGIPRAGGLDFNLLLLNGTQQQRQVSEAITEASCWALRSVRAGRMVAHFGTDIWRVINEEPQRSDHLHGGPGVGGSPAGSRLG